MSQCVPSWDLVDNPTAVSCSLRPPPSNSNASHVPTFDYEVAELTWENGQLAMHGLGPPRVPVKPSSAVALSKYSWDKLCANGTLESIVNQATRLPIQKPSDISDELLPWFNDHRAVVATTSASATMTMDALFPCSNWTSEQTGRAADSDMGPSMCVVGRSSRVGSCSGDVVNEPAKEARVHLTPERSSRDQSISNAPTFNRHSQRLTLDTCELDTSARFTSTSVVSPENTSSVKALTKATTADDHDSVSHSRPQWDSCLEENNKKGNGKSSVSSRRSRASAVHNQSERKRRNKINERMKTLQKMVPNSSKTDKASMLDEVIEYLKQLEAQVNMMSRLNMSSLMLPIAIQQQLQMAMMSPMGIGMNMNMGLMDFNSMSHRHNIPPISPLLHHPPFMPMLSWDSSGDQLQAPPVTVLPDHFSTFLACQSQPMTLDAYSRLAAMYQHLHQHPPSGSKN